MNNSSNTPLVSVVMAVYNGEPFVRKTIESVLLQTYSNFEFIIINDGSKDSSLDTIASFKDPRIRCISRKNKGLTPSLNEGLRAAQGTYIARIDADDIALPSRLETQVAFLETHPHIGLLGTWAYIIDENGNKKGMYTLPHAHKKIQRMMFWHNPFIHPSVMFPRAILDTVGFYNENFRYAQDYEYWSRIIKKYEVANLGEPLLLYRVFSESMTRAKKNAMRWEGIKIRFKYLFSK